ncbi:hypothetical protein O181_028536 [Austropuccinia psidii MF-1]|uniref:Uncharacterized protein n=1 Tax=Austropuccinia psidii MF-1 TaxID=1389203 RepID=A0A9Q3CPC4_9BASI|nr:hypothetical protein [Austropuccinia psidii MF-1]
MSSSFQSTNWSETPPDQLTEQLQNNQTPPISSYVLVLLPIFAAIFLAVFFLSVLVLVILIRRGRQNPQYKVWLWKKKYSTYRHSIPYLVPNGRVVVLASQLLSTIFFEIYIACSYASYKYPDKVNQDYRMAWLALTLIPSFLCFWWSGFSSLYACFFCRPWTSAKSQNKISAYVGHPLVMNIACLGPPLFIIAMSIYWTILAFHSYGNRQRARDGLMALLNEIKADSNINSLQTGTWVTKASPKVQEYVHSRDAFLDLLRQSFLFWTICTLCGTLFFTITAACSVKLMQLTLKTPPEKHQSENISAESVSGSTISKPLLSHRARRARTAYGFFALHCIFFIITSMERCIVDLAVYFNIKKATTQSKWQSLLVWLVLSGSVFMSLVLLIQWASVTDSTDYEDTITYSEGRMLTIPLGNVPNNDSNRHENLQEKLKVDV